MTDVLLIPAVKATKNGVEMADKYIAVVNGVSLPPADRPIYNTAKYLLDNGWPADTLIRFKHTSSSCWSNRVRIDRLVEIGAPRAGGRAGRPEGRRAAEG
jgi:hypothetical protein